MQEDACFIKKTLSLARRARGFTAPNPLVGALIVKNKKIIASGYHHRAGLPHAEIEAIRRSKENIRGATLYVNLEPCCHFGRTPPCVDEIIKHGIKRVVIATLDPNPCVHGKSVRKLKQAGIKVDVGICAHEACRLNEVFFTNMQKQKPFVVAKFAQSVDGKIATHTGISQWITSEKSREFARYLRDQYDCVLVGVNTVVQDNPRLDGVKKIPFKVIVDPHMRIPRDSFLMRQRRQHLILLVSQRYYNKQRRVPEGLKILYVKETQHGFSAKDILKCLYENGITSVFVEGGAYTLGKFFDEQCVDKTYIFISPKIIGGDKSLSAIGARGVSSPDCAPYLNDMTIRRLGNDVFITGYPVYKNWKS